MSEFSRTITVTGYRRPNLFRQLLQSLRANHLDGWRIYVQIEPSPLCDEFIACASELLAGCNYEISVNLRLLGVRNNPFVLLERVFQEGSRINIYLEEDLLVAPDITDLAVWYEKNHKPSWLCLSLLAGFCDSPGLISNTDYPDLLFPSKAFNSLGFVVLRDEWKRHFRQQWISDDDFMSDLRGERARGWDWAMFGHLLRAKALYSIQPVAARATTTGRDGGEHTIPEFFDRTFCDLPVVRSVTSGIAYQCVDAKELPGVVRRHVYLSEQFCETLRLFSERAAQSSARRRQPLLAASPPPRRIPSRAIRRARP